MNDFPSIFRAPFSTSRLDLHPEAVDADLGVGRTVWHGWQVGPDLQRGVPAVRDQALWAMRVECRLCPPAGWTDGEDGDGGQPSPQHQLHVHCGGLERRVGAAAQQEVLHPGQCVDQPARWVWEKYPQTHENFKSKREVCIKIHISEKDVAKVLQMGQTGTLGCLWTTFGPHYTSSKNAVLIIPLYLLSYF